MTIDYNNLCQKILEITSQIRFAGVANSNGEIVAGGHKENVEQILVNDEVGMSIHYALQKRDLYTNLAYKLGHEKSSITEYEKVTLISIPLTSRELCLISTEPRANYLKIIDSVLSIMDSQKSSN